MRDHNLLSPIAAEPWRKSPFGEIITLPPSFGPFGCSRWTTAGAGYSPPSSIGTPSASGMCASEATIKALQRSPWDLRGCKPRHPPARRGGWPCGYTLPVSVGTSPTRSIWGIVLRLRAAPDQRRVCSIFTLQGTDHPWPHLPQHRGLRIRSTGSSISTMPQWRGSERLSPAQARQAWHTAMSLRIFRMRQTCVQRTCDTYGTIHNPQHRVPITSSGLVLLRPGGTNFAQPLTQMPRSDSSANRQCTSLDWCWVGPDFLGHSLNRSVQGGPEHDRPEQSCC